MSDGSSDNEEFSSYSESEEVSDYESSDASDNGSELSESEATESIKEPVVKPKKKVETKVINENEVKKTKNEKKKDIEENEIFKWGFTLSEVYRSAVRFYKDKEGKAFNLSYADKVKLAALTKQVAFGPCDDCDKKQEIGYFDWFGNDRQKSWLELGKTKRTDAMADLVHLVDKTIPVFSPYMVALQKEREEKERLKREEEERILLEEQRRLEEIEKQKALEFEKQRKEEEEVKLAEQKALEEVENEKEVEKQKIISGLNAQTAAQFTQYAAQQHPGEPDEQKKLIQHLQKQHYEQYMAQLSQCSENEPLPAIPVSTTLGTKEIRIEPPSMWTRPQIRELKDQLRKDTESVLTVGRGEVVTVRVPTHEEGAYLFWEFASDSYDLGFGVYFEWSNVKTNQVSVAVNESSDEEDEEYVESEDEDYDGESTSHGDTEKGSKRPRSNRPPTDEIVPVYRRDCHIQVHAGSHQYPGSGVYLLKFDNSYSLWRSKTLYYRVYYTR